MSASIGEGGSSGTKNNDGVFHAFRLKPDGTRFERLVTFSATVPPRLREDGTFVTPAVVHRSGDETDVTRMVAR